MFERLGAHGRTVTRPTTVASSRACPLEPTTPVGKLVALSRTPGHQVVLLAQGAQIQGALYEHPHHLPASFGDLLFEYIVRPAGHIPATETGDERSKGKT